MPYWRLFYHLVWATAGRAPKLVGEAEATTCRVIQQVADQCRTRVIVVGTMPDHIHVVASIPPSIAISEVVKHIKGRSSRLINADGVERDAPTFGWQSEYGVLSFGERALARVVDYVDNHRDRHARKDLWVKLECLAGDAPDRGAQS